MEPAGQAALAQLDHRELAGRFDRPELTFVGGFENAIFDLGARRNPAAHPHEPSIG